MMRQDVYKSYRHPTGDSYNEDNSIYRAELKIHSKKSCKVISESNN